MNDTSPQSTPTRLGDNSSARAPQKPSDLPRLREELRLKDNSSYRVPHQKPPLKQCDLIMKGGVTSGVVYPQAILELATQYRFRSVGGTSAGAIAAAAAAAAEYGREKDSNVPGKPAGFAGLYDLMTQLEAPNFVRDLFQPAPEARSLFDKLLKLKKLLDERNKNRQQPSPSKGKSVLIFLELLATGVSLLPTLFLRGGKYLRNKDQSFFALCTGMPPETQEDRTRKGPPALTGWLHERIQRLAGLGLDSSDVLTLGRLQAKRLPDPDGSEEVGIDFQMVTTNLSHRQPYILRGENAKETAPRMFHPEELEASYLFKGSDMDKLFPPEVVEYLKTWTAHPEDWDTAPPDGQAPNGQKQFESDQKRFERENPFKRLVPPDGYYAFPWGNALPVLVATRMSLSFPFLLSAVRLYTVKPHVLNAQLEESAPRRQLTEADLEENWFSDGGIASNFPIHLFDAWIPTRPTFGLSLADSLLPPALGVKRKAPTHPENEGDAYLPGPGDLQLPSAFPIRQLLHFLGAILNTAQNYRDNTQARMPSYRERVVQVMLENGQGGLNLDMEPEVIQALAYKGHEAAEQLLQAFRFNDELRWKEHRWVRLLVLQARLEREFDALRKAYEKQAENADGSPNEPAVDAKTEDGLPPWAQCMHKQYSALMEKQLSQRSHEAPWYKDHDEKWCEEAKQRMHALLELMATWNAAQREWAKQGQDHNPERFFTFDEPFPRGILRVTPQN